MLMMIFLLVVRMRDINSCRAQLLDYIILSTFFKFVPPLKSTRSYIPVIRANYHIQIVPNVTSDEIIFISLVRTIAQPFTFFARYKIRKKTLKEPQIL